MVVCSSTKACVKGIRSLCGYFGERMRSHVFNMVSSRPSTSYILKQGNSRSSYSYSSVPSISSYLFDCGIQGFQRIQYRSAAVSKRRYVPTLTVKYSVRPKGLENIFFDFASDKNGSLRTLLVTRKPLFNFKCNFGPWPYGSVSAGLVSGLLVCYASSDSVHAEASGKKTCTDYTVIGCTRANALFLIPEVSSVCQIDSFARHAGIPGDGSCLFRSVAHGACLRSGKPAPSESLQKQLADELRARVADEFIKRRKETEWFIEGDFDNYVAQIRKPHVWGGEPELLTLSHVLRMPITVYMYDDNSGGLTPIAEYGQEYGKDNPIRVLYDGSGHYDALQIPSRKGPKSRL